jgi:hypothetical protein
VFTARYALSPYIKQIHFVFKGLSTILLLFPRTKFTRPKFCNTCFKMCSISSYFATCRWITFRGLTCQSDHASQFGASRRTLCDTPGNIKIVGWWLGHGLSGRGPLFQGYWPTGQPGSASYLRTRNGSYSACKFNYSKYYFYFRIP